MRIEIHFDVPLLGGELAVLDEREPSLVFSAMSAALHICCQTVVDFPHPGERLLGSLFHSVAKRGLLPPHNTGFHVVWQGTDTLG